MLKVIKGKEKIESDPRLNELITYSLDLRDKIEGVREELAALEKMRTETGDAILGYLDAAGIESARTNSGTATAKFRNSASCRKDPDAFVDYVMKHGAYWLMERRANYEGCRDHLEEHGKLPPGVTLNSQRYASVRKPAS